MSTVVDDRPGFGVGRLARLVRTAVDRLRIDLSGAAVLTEAATGAYVVTPVIAALAGAQVTAVTRTTRHGSAEEVLRRTAELAGRFQVEDRIRVVTERTPQMFRAADIITNSGHLRPIIGEFAEAIRPGAALSLMFEAWEIQAGRVDLDLDGIRSRGVRVAGTNERHPDIDVFSYLGSMAVAELADAGVPSYGNRIGVLCDNPFREFLTSGLTGGGAEVSAAASLHELPIGDLDALVVAVTPTGASVLTADDFHLIRMLQPDLVVLQYWGDISREAAAGVSVWPPSAPADGHMAVLPSKAGPDAIVNLQAGGLKVGELLLRDPASLSAAEREYLDEL
ncbi:hypothetical protein [Microbacterium sp. Bi121]|uniref:hypothetical protein n=1 Tax=Microbacterium sp. Bi121 TaxID=2822348 RepID=UPI001D6B03B6|nr:hypothetical protein [Microbacterium sp. Bi121]CAH0122850.1 hypothetical protein SRABI121_00019 [Microbacterium sp. Bi121]